MFSIKVEQWDNTIIAEDAFNTTGKNKSGKHSDTHDIYLQRFNTNKSEALEMSENGLTHNIPSNRDPIKQLSQNGHG